MKKFLTRIVLITILTLGLAVAAQADEWSFVKAGSMSYVSNHSALGVFFYGEAGESIAFVPYSKSTNVYCGMTHINADLDAEGFLATCGDYGFAATLPYDTLYLVVCVKAGGRSGDVIGGVFENNRDSRCIMNTEPKLVKHIDLKLEQRLLEATNKILGPE